MDTWGLVANGMRKRRRKRKRKRKDEREIKT